MSTPQKTEIINDLTQKFQNSSGIYFTKYSGMNVAHVTKLRKQFRASEVSYFVSKNTLTKIAANNAGFENKLDELLSGQIGIAYVAGDPTGPARVIRNFEKENKNSTFLISGKCSIFIKSIGKTAKPNTIKKILNTNLYFINFLFSNLLAIFLSLKY